MVFGIGSVTKLLVASLTLKLVDQGLLSLEKPVRDWFPPHPHIGGSITVRQLLGHTSGIANLWDNESIWGDIMANRSRYWRPEESLAYLNPPVFPPGEGFHYSNVNYLLLGMLIEQVTGMSLAAGLETHLWNPLNLGNLYLSQQQVLPDSQVHVYGDGFLFGGRKEDVTHVPRVSHESVIFGSGGVFTTAEDLARFGNQLFGGHVISRSALTEMLTLKKFEPHSNMRAYGLGVQEFTRKFSLDEHAIGHGGATIGTTTYLIHLPDYRSTIVVMINAFPNRGADYIARGLMKSLIESMESE
jgi:D-alanyl-D-alanine carboxypeptidase